MNRTDSHSEDLCKGETRVDSRAGDTEEMAEPVSVLTALPEDPGSAPSTHVVTQSHL